MSETKTPLEKTETHTSVAVAHAINEDGDVAALYYEHEPSDPKALRSVRLDNAR